MSENFREIFKDYQEISLRYDMEYGAIWCYFNPKKRPCFSTVLLQEAKEIQQAIIGYFKTDEKREKYPIHYLILASQTPGVFNFGGDLHLFKQLITDRKRDQLLEYAKSCIDICYLNAVNLHLPLTTISLVEGSALGGGFESALSSNVLVAEKYAQMGFPEIRFNLFPGMGAYSLLARKLGMNEAAKMLQGGKIFNALELHEMGVVDVLAEFGKGSEAVNQYIKQHSRAANGMQAIQAVRQFYNPITYEELLRITEIWVDAALRLSRKDLRKMERLVSAQNRGNFHPDPVNNKILFVRTKQDRRFDYQNVTFPLMDSSGKHIPYDRRQTERRDSIDRHVHN